MLLLLLLLLVAQVSAFNRPLHRSLRPQVRPTLHHVRSTTTTTSNAEPLLTQRILEAIPPEDEAGGAGGAVSAPNTWEALQGADRAWAGLKSGKGLPPLPSPFVREVSGRAPGGHVEAFDVVVCGGTLGVFIGAALAAKHGLKVAVVSSCRSSSIHLPGLSAWRGAFSVHSGCQGA